MKSVKSVIYIFLVSFFITACGVQNETRASNSIQERTNKSEETSGFNSTNPYFFDKGITSFSLSGEMNFNEWGDTENTHDKIEYSIDKVVEKADGCVYRIRAQQFTRNKIPSARLNIGYFYVQKSKIIRLVEDRENPWNLSEKALSEFEKKDILPRYSAVVCQEQEVMDELTPSYKKGWHSYIKTNGNVVKYGQYQNAVTDKDRESYFWEHIYWERNKGIIGYDCGYKAGVDYFKLDQSYDN